MREPPDPVDRRQEDDREPSTLPLHLKPQTCCSKAKAGARSLLDEGQKLLPLPSEYGTDKTVKATFRPWLSGHASDPLGAVQSSRHQWPSVAGDHWTTLRTRGRGAQPVWCTRSAPCCSDGPAPPAPSSSSLEPSLRVSGFGFQISGFGFRVSVFGFRVSGLRVRVWGLGFVSEGG